MMTQAEMAEPDQKKPKRLYAIMYPDCLIDGGGPLTMQDVMMLSRENTVGFITPAEVKIPKHLTTIIDFSIMAADTMDASAFSQVLIKIAENFEADEYYLVARGFRFVQAATLGGFILIFPHSLLAELHRRRLL